MTEAYPCCRSWRQPQLACNGNAAWAEAEDSPISDLLVQAVELLGWLGIAVAAVIIAPEAIVPFVGYAASQSQIDPVIAVLAASVGGTVGSTLIYVLARWLAARPPRHGAVSGRGWPMLHKGDLERATALFRRHGGWIVVFGRFVPTVRSIVSVPAGLVPMAAVPFVALTFLGTTLWNALLLGVGHTMGASWEELEAYLGTYGTVATMAFLAAVAVWLLLRARARLIGK